MPCHIISDAHEWINEFLTVFISYPVKLLIRERSFSSQRGKKTMFSLTLAISVIWCVWSRISGLTCQFNFGNERNRLLNDVKMKF